MRLIDLLHRWTGGVIGLLLMLLGLSGALLVHKEAWVALPHVRDTQVQDTQAIAAAVERLMADPAARPRSIVFATRDFGLNRLSYGGNAGAYADQQGAIVTRWHSRNGPKSGCSMCTITCFPARQASLPPASPPPAACSSWRRECCCGGGRAGPSKCGCCPDGSAGRRSCATIAISAW